MGPTSNIAVYYLLYRSSHIASTTKSTEGGPPKDSTKTSVREGAYKEREREREIEKERRIIRRKGGGGSMNSRGHLLHQSSPVQQMMANPNWLNINNINNIHPQQPSPFLSSPSNFLPNHHHHLPSWQHDLNNNQQPLPDSWTQLLMYKSNTS